MLNNDGRGDNATHNREPSFTTAELGLLREALGDSAYMQLMNSLNGIFPNQGETTVVVITTTIQPIRESDPAPVEEDMLQLDDLFPHALQEYTTEPHAFLSEAMHSVQSLTQLPSNNIMYEEADITQVALYESTTVVTCHCLPQE